MTRTLPPDALSHGRKGQVAIERAPLSSGNLRGQVATEFMLYTAVFMFVAVAAFVVVGDLQRSEVPLQQNTLAKETGEGFASVLTLSVKGGQGFAYNYTFPRTIFGKPYLIDMQNLNHPNATILIEWIGDYGPFAYQIDVPNYHYLVSGGCISGSVMNSTSCTDMLMLKNDGENLTITQVP